MAKKINEVKVQNRGQQPFSVIEHFQGATQEWTILPSQEVILHTLPQEIKGQNYRFMHVEVNEIDIPDVKVIIEEPKVEVKKGAVLIEKAMKLTKENIVNIVKEPKPTKRRKTYRRTKR